MAASNELPVTGGHDLDGVIAMADRLRWRAPELVLSLVAPVLRGRQADQVDRTGGGAPELRVRAHGLAASALVRLGRPAEAVEHAAAMVRRGSGEPAAAARIDLAACARAIGLPLIGIGVLKPVFAAVGLSPVVRARAISQLVGCAAHIGRRDDLEDALAEADRLVARDGSLTVDAQRVERAQLAVRTAAYHRRHGDTEAAEDAARDGLAQLSRLANPGLEAGQVKARLCLEMVCALLDEGRLDETRRVAAEVLALPVRATFAAPSGRIALAVVTRITIPVGDVEPARLKLVELTATAERHGLHSLHADALTVLAHAEELAGRPADALAALRSARVCEHHHERAQSAARRLVTAEFGSVEPSHDEVRAMLRTVIRAPATVVGAPAKPSAPAVPAPVSPVAASERVLPLTQRPVPLTLVRPKAAAPAVPPAATPVVEVNGHRHDDSPGTSSDEQEARHGGEGAEGESVLSKLGISAGSGGRRRAPSTEDAEQPSDPAAPEAPPAAVPPAVAKSARLPEPTTAPPKDHPPVEVPTPPGYGEPDDVPGATLADLLAEALVAFRAVNGIGRDLSADARESAIEPGRHRSPDWV